MEIRDLRVGNIVEKWDVNPQLNIRSSLGYLKIIKLDDGYINGIEEKYFEPVLLSEFKLHEFGFAKYGDKWTNHNVDLKLIEPNKFELFFSGNMVYNSLTFLHELQNLHLFYTKQELEVDLN